MQIRELFATAVQDKIEPIVKVADRKPAVIGSELANLVITPQWERHIHRVLDAYVNAADRETEQSIGLWISGFFGSGKSLLMKIIGLLLEGGELEGRTIHDLFLDRLPMTSPDRADIKRFLTIIRRLVTTTSVGGNLHSMLTDADDRLPLIAFKLFAEQRTYTHNWPFAWGIEYQIDEQGLTELFRAKATAYAGEEWEDLILDPEFYLEDLYRAAADVLGDRFSGPEGVERAVHAVARNGIDSGRVVQRFRRWCEARDGEGKRHKLLLQLDELGQWIAAGNANDRTMQVQALVEEAAENGGGRVWLSVTAHGDVQALKQNVQQEYYAKIIKRFAIQCRLSNEDISQVVEERVLRKTQPGRVALTDRFRERSGEIVDIGRVDGPQRVYPSPDEENFALFYPYMPWTVTVIPDVVKGIAQAANRDEALTGSNRTMIAVVQGGLIENAGTLAMTVGGLVPLAALYGQFSDDVPVETKTDLHRIHASVADATDFTALVACGLFLLGQAAYIPTTLDNVTRTVVDRLDASLPSLRKRVKEELTRLVDARYAKQVGDLYFFLTTQQRSFQDKVRARQEELLSQSYELIQKLKEYDSESALRFDRVPLQDRELALQLELDGRMVRNPTGAQVMVRVYSPLQRALDPQVADDGAMRQRSAQEPNAIFLRMGEVSGFRGSLALAAATEELADNIIAARSPNGGEIEVARQAKQADLPTLKEAVRATLGQAVRGGTIFFRGTLYQLAAGESAGDAVRATLAQILPAIYPRFHEVTHRILNEQSAVRAALQNNAGHQDLKALGVYRADGTLNEGHPLISALRGRLPLAEQDQEPMSAADLRREFEAPPYGWDGNGVKVGLALLLRASACRLIESGQAVTDPSSGLAEQLLATESRFRSIRVQGTRGTPPPSELKSIRDRMRQVFGLAHSPALVAATLNNGLGEELSKVVARADDVGQWAHTAQCPLPLAFAGGKSVAQELLNSGAMTARLAAFRDQADTLQGFVAELTNLERFRQEQAQIFAEMRDFYNRMVNAGADLEPLFAFLADFRTVSQERTVTDPARWNELNRSYSAARQAVDAQTAHWRTEITDHLAGLPDSLTQAASWVGVPATNLADEVADLSRLYDPIRTQLERDAETFGQMRHLRTAWTGAELAKADRLRELRERYKADDVAPLPATQLAWRELTGGPVTLTDPADLDRLLADLREKLAAQLAQTAVIVS